jgi:hypothetical protein
MGHFLLSMRHGEPPADVAAEMTQIMADVDAFGDRLKADGQWVYGGGLLPADTALVVDGTGQDAVITDGPFPEAKEHLGGFWIIDAPSQSAAVALATTASRACRLPLEVREFHAEPTP